MMTKRIARLEYRCLIHRDAADKQHEEHIITIRLVGENMTQNYKFTIFEDAMRLLNKISQVSDDHS
jgi:pterin-4a-carbinolamine dehydratase